jgi:ankyrin repeat protein
MLLDAGAAIDHAGENGISALHAAAANGHVEVVRELIARGAAVASVDRRGATPLILAAEYPALVSDETRGSIEPYLADWRKCGAEIVRLLLAHGASVDRRDQDGATALTRALHAENVDTVRVLFEHGAAADQSEAGALAALLRRGAEAEIDSE